MATEAELLQALDKADRAGHQQDVADLTVMLRSMRGSAPASQGSPDPDVPTLPTEADRQRYANRPSKRLQALDAIVSDPAGAIVDTALSAGSGMVAGVVGPALGVLGRVGSWMGVAPAEQADRTAESVAGALTHNPRTEGGRVGTQVLDEVSQRVLIPLGPTAGGGATSPVMRPQTAAVGAVRRAAATADRARVAAGNQDALARRIEAAPARRFDAATRGMRTGQAIQATDAQAALNNWAQQHRVDLTQLDPQLLADLENAARTPEGLQGISAPEIVRQNAMQQRAGVIPTRAQTQPTVANVAAEEAISKQTDASVLHDVRDRQERSVLQSVRDLRRAYEGVPHGREAVGETVQNQGIRALERADRQSATQAYTQAARSHPDVTVDPQPIIDLLDQNPERQHLDWLSGWRRKARLESTTAGAERPRAPNGRPIGIATAPQTEVRGITLEELNDLRVKANSVIRRGGPDSHFAMQVVNAVDKVGRTVPEAVQGWRDATAKWRQYRSKWHDNKLVDALGGERGRVYGQPDPNNPVNPRIPAEQTVQRLLSDTTSLRDLRTLDTVLGGEGASHPAARAARSAISAGVIDHLYEKLRTGEETAATGEHGGPTLHINVNAFLKEYERLRSSGKLDLLLSPAQRNALGRIAQDARLMTAKPKRRIAGSDTGPNLAAEEARRALEAAQQAPEAAPPEAGPSPSVASTVAGKVARGGAMWMAHKVPGLGTVLSTFEAMRDNAIREKARLDKLAADEASARQAAIDKAAARDAKAQETLRLNRERLVRARLPEVSHRAARANQARAATDAEIARRNTTDRTAYVDVQRQRAERLRQTAAQHSAAARQAGEQANAARNRIRTERNLTPALTLRTYQDDQRKGRR